MQVKKGVDLRFIRPEIMLKLPNVEQIFCWHLPESYVFTLTSGADGKHKTGSKHYINLAVDIRIWWPDPRDGRKRVYPTAPARDALLRDLQKYLGDDYDLFWHNGSHCHLEFDP